MWKLRRKIGAAIVRANAMLLMDRVAIVRANAMLLMIGAAIMRANASGTLRDTVCRVFGYNDYSICSLA